MWVSTHGSLVTLLVSSCAPCVASRGHGAHARVERSRVVECRPYAVCTLCLRSPTAAAANETIPHYTGPRRTPMPQCATANRPTPGPPHPVPYPCTQYSVLLYKVYTPVPPLHHVQSREYAKSPLLCPLCVQLVLLFEPVHMLVVLLGHSQRASRLLWPVVMEGLAWIARQPKERDICASLQRNEDGIEA